MPNKVIRDNIELSTARKLLALAWAEQVVVGGEKRVLTSEEVRRLALQADYFAGLLSDVCIAYYEAVRNGEREIPNDNRPADEVEEQRAFWRQLYTSSLLYDPNDETTKERFN